MKVTFKNKSYNSYPELLDKLYKDKPLTLLTSGESNSKLKKGITEKMSVSIMHLLPHDQADQLMGRAVTRTVCPFAISAKCWKPCLNTAGRGGITKKGETTNAIQLARLRRTLFYLDHRQEFLAQLCKEIQKFVTKCQKDNIKPCIRLNGTSDIQWELIPVENYANIFDMFSEVQFYDYTKIPTRKVSHIKNYHLTWSYSEANDKYAGIFDQVPYNKAVVFNGGLPRMFRGMKVIDGDKTDMRFLDKQNRVVGLKAKGLAKKDTSGFVIQTLQIA